MSKPLHKDPSFWIVAVVALGFVNGFQLSVGLPYLKERMQNMQPAPRSPVSSAGADGTVETVALDFSEKTYPWQQPRPDGVSLDDLPEQVVIIASEYSPPSGGWSMQRSNAVIGIRMPAESLLSAAYEWNSRARLVLPDPRPTGSFDYLAKRSSGSREALQRRIEFQLGLVAERQTRSMDVLLLRAWDDDPSDPSEAADSPGLGRIGFGGVENFIRLVESYLGLPVLDESGLPGDRSITMSQRVFAVLALPSGDRLGAIRDILREEVGLDLVETNMPVEILLVRRVEPMLGE